MENRMHREYENITTGRIAQIISELAAGGIRVTGNNPWDIHADNVGLRLRAVWAGEKSTLAVFIVKKGWYISSDLVWSKIDALLVTKETARANELQAGNGPA